MPIANADASACRSLCHGIRAACATSKYVLCLDDDVQLHRSTLTDLVTRLERDPTFFMATGYPFDVPAAGAGLLAYCVLVYHLPLLIAFATSDVTLNVWGGCMLLPLRHLRHDSYGIMRVRPCLLSKCHVCVVARLAVSGMDPVRISLQKL